MIQFDEIKILFDIVHTEVLGYPYQNILCNWTEKRQFYDLMLNFQILY